MVTSVQWKSQDTLNLLAGVFWSQAPMMVAGCHSLLSCLNVIAPQSRVNWTYLWMEVSCLRRQGQSLHSLDSLMTPWSSRAGESLGLIYNQFGIIQVLQRSPILQTSNWSGTFFAVPFNKPALDRCLAYNEHTRRKLLYFVSYFAVKKCQNLIFKGNY